MTRCLQITASRAEGTGQPGGSEIARGFAGDLRDGKITEWVQHVRLAVRESLSTCPPLERERSSVPAVTEAERRRRDIEGEIERLQQQLREMGDGRA